MGFLVWVWLLLKIGRSGSSSRNKLLSFWYECDIFYYNNKMLSLTRGDTYFSITYVFGTLHITLNRIENVDPSPKTLFTLTVPPIYSTIDLQMDRPRPLPVGFVFRCSSKLLKLINRPFSLSWGIPQPKSWIPNSNLI